MIDERTRRRLIDMREHAAKAREFLGQLTVDELAEDDLHAFAVTRAIQIVGEAARKVPHDVRARLPEVAWKKAVSMRNLLVHDYGDIDLPILWDTVRNDLPPLIAALDRLLAETPE